MWISSPHSGVSAQFSCHSPTALHSLPTSPCVCNFLCHRSRLQVNSSELWMSVTWVATEEMGFVFVCSQSFKLLKKLLPASRFWETLFLCLYVEKKTEIVSHNTKVVWLYLLLRVTLSALLLFSSFWLANISSVWIILPPVALTCSCKFLRLSFLIYIWMEIFFKTQNFNYHCI